MHYLHWEGMRGMSLQANPNSMVTNSGVRGNPAVGNYVLVALACSRAWYTHPSIAVKAQIAIAVIHTLGPIVYYTSKQIKIK